MIHGEVARKKKMQKYLRENIMAGFADKYRF